MPYDQCRQVKIKRFFLMMNNYIQTTKHDVHKVIERFLMTIIFSHCEMTYTSRYFQWRIRSANLTDNCMLSISVLYFKPSSSSRLRGKKFLGLRNINNNQLWTIKQK
jgi:hypothetical protein